MNEIANDAPTTALNPHVAAINEHLHKIHRRQWSMWSTTVAVMLLLTVCIASFAFPGLLSKEQSTYSFFLNQAVRGLVGMVLLFSVYLVYQQVLIGRLRHELEDQICSLAKVENLASEVYKLAAIDQLTGLYNRRSGEQRLHQEIGRAQRHGRPLTVLLLDLDGLKQVNDKHGHAAGDSMIKGFAERLQRAIRGSDVAIRQGGDEFMVVLPECRVEEVHHVLGRIQGLVIEINNEKIPCNFSRGWTDYKPGESLIELIKRADDLLYDNKREGKAGVSESPAEQQPQAIP
ncbi:MAG: GGDEF domain-containing protein [Candidatus Acidiferrales bacterium]